MRIVARGNANRAVASTHMNAHSSRSHAVLIARIERKDYATTTTTTRSSASTPTPTQQLRISHLYLVDLAGSERVKKARVVGRHVNELKAINLSLSALGNCIAALSRQQPQRHVPYRDSKLTRLLQSSLGGNAKTALVVTVSPSATEAQETLSTLQFGQRAMKVTVQAHRNVLSVLDYKALYEETQQALDERQQQMQRLESELAAQCHARQAAEDQLMKAQLRIQHLEFECQAAKLSSSSSTNNNGDKSARGGAGSSSSLEPQLAALVAQHERDVAVVKERCDVHIATYKRLADEAQQEWHDLEDELAKEKQQVLVTLQELKEFKLRFFELEQETTERIAELVQDAKDREREARDERTELQQTMQAQQKTAASLQDKVQNRYRGWWQPGWMTRCDGRVGGRAGATQPGAPGPNGSRVCAERHGAYSVLLLPLYTVYKYIDSVTDQADGGAVRERHLQAPEPRGLARAALHQLQTAQQQQQ
ncbi:hypothetical protein PINS_up004611 [Pythium insidiosum]|nr:hypothetical protein PINS_up004611 [Pythium insidiosum]